VGLYNLGNIGNQGLWALLPRIPKIAQKKVLRNHGLRAIPTKLLKEIQRRGFKIEGFRAPPQEYPKKSKKVQKRGLRLLVARILLIKTQGRGTMILLERKSGDWILQRWCT